MTLVKICTIFFKKNCLLCIALLDMDDARGTFVTFKKLFNSCRHELEEWWSMMDILAKFLKLNVLMRKKCLLYIVPTSFFFIWGHSNIKIVIFYTEVVVFLFDEWNDWKNSQFNFLCLNLFFFSIAMEKPPKYGIVLVIFDRIWK